MAWRGSWEAVGVVSRPEVELLARVEQRVLFVLVPLHPPLRPGVREPLLHAPPAFEQHGVEVALLSCVGAESGSGGGDELLDGAHGLEPRIVAGREDRIHAEVGAVAEHRVEPLLDVVALGADIYGGADVLRGVVGDLGEVVEVVGDRGHGRIVLGSGADVKRREEISQISFGQDAGPPRGLVVLDCSDLPDLIVQEVVRQVGEARLGGAEHGEFGHLLLGGADDLAEFRLAARGRVLAGVLAAGERVDLHEGDLTDGGGGGVHVGIVPGSGANV